LADFSNPGSANRKIGVPREEIPLAAFSAFIVKVEAHEILAGPDEGLQAKATLAIPKSSSEWNRMATEAGYPIGNSTA
jgi:hypothetical protein